MDKIKICLLSYDLRSGGAERVISQWSTLLKDDYDVYMTTFQNKVMYPFSGKYVCLDVKDSYSTPIHKVWNVIKRGRALRKFVEREKINIVLSFCNECNLANTISRHKAIKICSIRSASDIEANRFVKYVIKSKDNSIIIQTEALKQHLIDQFGESLSKKLIVYGNPFNVAKIREMAKEPAPDNLMSTLSNYRCLVNVGSFKEAKNHANLLKSFELIAKEIDDVALVLVGANIYLQEQIAAMAAKSAFPDRIIFAGETQNPFAIESKSSVFVFPSLAEGIPNALAEAMIVGLPVVSSNCPTGPAELLSKSPFEISYNVDGYCDADYGILVKPFSGASKLDYEDINEENVRFAKPIIKALKDKEYYDSLVKRSTLGANRFDLEQYKTGLIEIIENIVYGR